ncbi:hypothetical protein ACJX0J_006081 [Zea mays]
MCCQSLTICEPDQRDTPVLGTVMISYKSLVSVKYGLYIFVVVPTTKQKLHAQVLLELVDSFPGQFFKKKKAHRSTTSPVYSIIELPIATDYRIAHMVHHHRSFSIITFGIFFIEVDFLQTTFSFLHFSIKITFQTTFEYH